MWTYLRHRIEDPDLGGKYPVRVTLADGDRREAFYLEFATPPDDATVQAHAAARVAAKNAKEERAGARVRVTFEHDKHSGEVEMEFPQGTGIASMVKQVADALEAAIRERT